MIGYTIALSETKNPSAEGLYECLRQELHWSVFYPFDIRILLPLEDQAPDLIVVDLNHLPFKAAKAQLARLRNAFPKAGILIYSEDTELGSLAIHLPATIAHNHLIQKMFMENIPLAHLAQQAVLQARTVS